MIAMITPVAWSSIGTACCSAPIVRSWKKGVLVSTPSACPRPDDCCAMSAYNEDPRSFVSLCRSIGKALDDGKLLRAQLLALQMPIGMLEPDHLSRLGRFAPIRHRHEPYPGHALTYVPTGDPTLHNAGPRE